jgi:hypothetical protein
LLAWPGLAQQSSNLPVMDVPGDPVSASESNVDLATVTCPRTIPYFT